MSKKETKALEVKQETQLAGALPSGELQERLMSMRENMESVDNFRVPRIVNTSDGLQLSDDVEPMNDLEVSIIHVKKQNQYYAKPYNPAEALPPDCYSMDGKVPHESVKNPVHATCKGCPMAEFGTNSMKSGKACRNLKLLFVLVGEKSIIPRQITVTPMSLKAADQYFLNLTEYGIPYRGVRTVISTFKKNPKQTYVELKFKQGRVLNDQEKADLNYLRAQWLPIMDAQKVDQSEIEVSNESKAKTVESTEY